MIPKYKRLPRFLDGVATVYVSFFRGTPIVVQLLIGYYVLLPALDVRVDALVCCIAIFGLNSGAYVSEIMRGGINSVDAGQMEAGRAVGLSYATTMVKIVIPQAIKNILPTLGNEFITLIKETSVLSLIAVTDLTKSFKAIAESTYEYFIPYIMLAVTYFVIVYIISLLVKFMERRLNTDARK